MPVIGYHIRSFTEMARELELQHILDELSCNASWFGLLRLKPA